MILVETNRHDAISAVECFLHSVAMVHVYVDVEDSAMSSEQLVDGEHYVIEIAEALTAFFTSVMQPA